MTESITRDSMQYDVVIVGAGPSGLEEQAIAGLKQHKKGLIQQLFPVAG
ncbi:hypothetical protein [Neisseria sp.]